MKNLTPVPKETRPPLPDFKPVPRRHRHDGWTPERQKAFIEALADTGCVARACALVNMSNEGVYYLRRLPGAEEFRAAWDAALDFGLLRLKDLAFQRAIEGEMIPVFQGGKLVGFRRKHNDRMLMFCLRHYGQDAQGKRTTINYFSTRAQAGVTAGEGGAAAAAEASTTTVRTVIAGDGNAGDQPARIAAAADRMEAFEGLPLDPTAQAEINGALEACAARYRDAQAVIENGGDDAIDARLDLPGEHFVPVGPKALPWHGPIETPAPYEEFTSPVEGEDHWIQAGADLPEWAQKWLDEKERPVAEVARKKPKRRGAGKPEESQDR